MDFPGAATNTITQISHFSVLFWFSFSLGVLLLGLLICWYCRQVAQQHPEVVELPCTILEIANLDLNKDGRRRKAPKASAPPYAA